MWGSIQIIKALFLKPFILFGNSIFANFDRDKYENGEPSAQYEFAISIIDRQPKVSEGLIRIAALQDNQKSIHWLKQNYKVMESQLLTTLINSHEKYNAIYSFGQLDNLKKKQLNKMRSIGNQGDINMQYLMWWLYVNDLGISKAEAYTWLKQAAGNEHPRALFSLGILYHYGYIVPIEPKKAKNLFNKSSDTGFNLATQFLKNIELIHKKLTHRHKIDKVVINE